MATKLGSTTISKLYLGSTEITKAYLGSTEVYSSGAPVTNDAFELTVETTAANETFLLPMTGVTSIDVDWGDGTVDTGITSDDPTHVYATAGTYSISVTGTADTVTWSNTSSQRKIITVTNLGDLGWTTFASSFLGCYDLTSFACGDCNTSNVTSMYYMFRFATSMTTCDVSAFDTSNVSVIFRAFGNTPSLQSLTGLYAWDVTSVTFANDLLVNSGNPLTTAEYDATLIAWAAQSVNQNVNTNFGSAIPTASGRAARDILVGTYGWTITDGEGTFT